MFVVCNYYSTAGLQAGCRRIPYYVSNILVTPNNISMCAGMPCHNENDIVMTPWHCTSRTHERTGSIDAQDSCVTCPNTWQSVLDVVKSACVVKSSQQDREWNTDTRSAQQNGAQHENNNNIIRSLY